MFVGSYHILNIILRIIGTDINSFWIPLLSLPLSTPKNRGHYVVTVDSGRDLSGNYKIRKNDSAYTLYVSRNNIYTYTILYAYIIFMSFEKPDVIFMTDETRTMSTVENINKYIFFIYHL